MKFDDEKFDELYTEDKYKALGLLIEAAVEAAKNK